MTSVDMIAIGKRLFQTFFSREFVGHVVMVRLQVFHCLLICYVTHVIFFFLDI